MVIELNFAALATSRVYPTDAKPPARRACLGELIQIDGSEHPWFEKRASQCTLLGVRGRYDEPAAFEFGGSDAS